MIPSNEIQKKQKWTAMMHSGTRHKKKKNLFHLSQTVVLPLLATTSGATDCEWDREEWEIVGKCK